MGDPAAPRPAAPRPAARWPQLAASSISAVARAQVVASFRTREPAVALTLDDGPHPATTLAVLEALRDGRGQATFFSIGERAADYPDLLGLIAAGGHELANHLFQDTPSVLLSASEFDRQLHRTHDLLIPYGPVGWFRPGSGWFTPRMLRAGARLGYRCALGSPGLVTADYADPAGIAAKFSARARAGDVIVLHEGTAARTDAALVVRGLVAGLAARGLRTLTLTGLAAVSQP